MRWLAVIALVSCSHAQPKAVSTDASGRQVGGVHESAPLGLKFTVPDGFSVVPDPSMPDLPWRADVILLKTPPDQAPSMGILGFRLSAYAETLDKSFGDFARDVLRTYDVQPTGRESIDLGWTKGETQAYSNPTQHVSGRLILLPLCDGKATLVFSTAAHSDDTGNALEQWPRTASRAGHATICQTIGTSSSSDAP